MSKNIIPVLSVAVLAFFSSLQPAATKPAAPAPAPAAARKVVTVSASDYGPALKEIEKLWDAKPNTSKGDRLDVLVTLVEAYEQRHYKFDPPDPVEAIKFRMEQLGLKPSDLAKILGGRSRVSEVLNRKRKLTVDMMRSLREHLSIPADSLLA